MPAWPPRRAKPRSADLLLLLEREPGLNAIHAHVRQKPIQVSKRFRAAASPSSAATAAANFGYGHVKRMVALARALRDTQGLGVVFAFNGSDDAQEHIAPGRLWRHQRRASGVGDCGGSAGNPHSGRAAKVLLVGHWRSSNARSR